ncbi:MAG: hypothetical protein IK083_08505 [Abditibacteriota bacterium]|nr:hypothetical protein [Abditibacteriota bacterium]
MKRSLRAVLAVLAVCTLSGAVFGLSVIDRPIDSALSSLFDPIAKSLGLSSDKVKLLENGDSWTNIICDDAGSYKACDIYTVTNTKKTSPEGVEVTRMIRKQAPMTADGKSGEFRSFDVWFLQKNDGTLYFYADNIPAADVMDPTCGVIYDKAALGEPRWYQRPLEFLPGKLKKGRKWEFVSPAGVKYACIVEKTAKISSADDRKLDTWLVRYETEKGKTVYRWVAPQIGFYLRSCYTADSDAPHLSIISDLLIPMK